MEAIYARQSLDKKDSLSIDSQVELCRERVKTEPIIFIDRKSAKDTNRQQLQEMINLIHAGSIQKVYVYRLDRLSRNVFDYLTLAQDFAKHGCTIEYVTENFGDGQDGDDMRLINAIWSQRERIALAKRVTDNYYYRVSQGMWGGGPAPYGYSLQRTKVQNKKHTILVINPETAPILQNIYAWYLEPVGSVSYILNKLNHELHIPSYKGSLWTSRVVVDLLSRAGYAPNDMQMYKYLSDRGCKMLCNVDDMDGEHSLDVFGYKDKSKNSKHKRIRGYEHMCCALSVRPPIVTTDIWLDVQEKRERLIKNNVRRAGTGKHSIYTGLLICGHCGYHMSYSCGRNDISYYLCSCKKNRGRNACIAHSWRQDKTDTSITNAILHHYNDPSLLAELCAAKDELPEDYSQQMNNYKSKIAAIRLEMDNIVSVIAQAKTTLLERLNARMDNLDQEEKRIMQEIESYEVTIRKRRHHISEYEMLKTLEYQLLHSSFEEQTTITHLLVDSIKLTGTSDIEIIYKV